MTAAPEMTLTVPRPGSQFYDSAAYQFPEGALAITEYADGPNTWAKVRGPRPTARETFPFVHSITIEGGTGPVQRRCLILDYEQYLRTYSNGQLDRDWGEARLQGGERAVFYCDRANLVRLAAAVGHLIFTNPRTLFWIPTADEVNWTQAQLAADINQNWSVSVTPLQIWANQNRWGPDQTGGDWDSSNLLGAW